MFATFGMSHNASLRIASTSSPAELIPMVVRLNRLRPFGDWDVVIGQLSSVNSNWKYELFISILLNTVAP